MYKKTVLALSVEDAARWDRVNDCGQYLQPVTTKNQCKGLRCGATGVVIEKGQECILLVASEVEDRVAVFANLEAFQMFLDASGSLEMLQQLRQRAAEQRSKIGKPRPVFPHQQVCNCVQCGGQIIRPAGMPLKEFSSIFRCKKCLRSGKPMPLNQNRFCRTCGLSFAPPPGKGGCTRRLCDKCRQ